MERGPAFIQACHDGDVDAVQSLLQAEAGDSNGDVDRLLNDAGYSSTPLVTAVRRGHSHIVQALLTAGADPRVCGTDGCFPLRAAIDSGDGAVAAVVALLEAGMDANTSYSSGGLSFTSHINMRMLGLAARAGHAQIVAALLAHGADVDKGDVRFGLSPLTLAAKGGHTEVVRVLAAAGANLNHKGGFVSMSPLAAAAMAGHLGVVSELLDAGADVNSGVDTNTGGGVCSPGFTALGAVAAKGDVDAARALVAAGAVVNGSGALTKAAKAGHVEMVKYLLSEGAVVDLLSSEHGTPLMWACREGHGDVVDLLLASGANASYVTPQGDNVVSAAIASGSAALLDTILGAGAVVECKVAGSMLSLAMCSGRSRLVPTLVAYGADLERQTSHSSEETALYSAASSMGRSLIPYLVSVGACLEGSGRNGRTALFGAGWGSAAALYALIRVGADPHVTFIPDKPGDKTSLELRPVMVGPRGLMMGYAYMVDDDW